MEKATNRLQAENTIMRECLKDTLDYLGKQGPRAVTNVIYRLEKTLKIVETRPAQGA